ncbi:KpsF/GutQ family sugar-phosphate isomerase [Ectothiorhodospira sp. BSL-9]|uniref:KpsF/GutQ family sugar-phosphate isomerase n=1 Tax=Ectothiorhodospira sp. BSL-9 TaxID=1442136 RepID=UPI0007B429D4|nr:KpsF/GutQ family sugar-phosphate isomerase [Ectothiorhodospira sp. BSL-9]ANB01354.1 D-arabinose 5-phosphate isomerase [Ectothiorhodospira sp. BSL-9]TVQ75209.1 MAG: KpsF/GutQ family sugar-phosphate isomerase [Chromatiaceae bacterium]
MKLNPDKTLDMARAVLETEAQGIRDLISRLDERFVRACEYMLACTGRVVVTGMGKSGHVGGKIAATLASTGTPAFFVHPGEASHGDLGMITTGDTVLALSNSGETDELLTILPLIRRLGAPLIALTGNPRSTLAREANVHLDVSVAAEACPLGLAPTSSTTATLAMGDALAVAMLEARGFTADDFARSHPGGRLGRRLLLHVGDIMHTGERIPLVRADAPLTDALMEITRQGLGMTAVVDEHRNLIGVYTDGDLRRTLDRGIDIRSTCIGDVMTRQCKTVQSGMLAAEALKVMEDHKISALPVVDVGQRLVGALNMHDLLRAGVV